MKPGSSWVSRSLRKNVPLAGPAFLRLTGLGLAMALLLGVSLFWQVSLRWHQDQLKKLEAYGRLVASRLAMRSAPLLTSRNPAQLQSLLLELSEEVPLVNSLSVRDEDGRPLAETSPADPKARVLEVTVPVTGQASGSVGVAMNETHLTAELASLTRRLVSTLLLITVLGFIGAWWTARLFERPVRELVRNVQAVKAGDFSAWMPVQARNGRSDLASAFNELVNTIQEKEALRRHLAHNLLTAQEEERKRIARELHDHTGQALTSVIAGIAALKPGPHTQKQLNDLLRLAAQTLSDVHDLSRALLPASLDELGLAVALPRLCESCAEQLAVKITCETIGLDQNTRLPRPLEVALYRIGQEAVTNAVRHGRARSIDVVVQRKAASVLAVIEDDGRGFDATDWRARCTRDDHLGLLSIEERATLLGGTFRIESRPGTGTSLFVEIPLPEVACG